jgi:hypothetical protein
MHGEEDNLDVGEFGADRLGSFQTRTIRQGEVHENAIRLVQACLNQRVLYRPRSTDHVNTGLGAQHMSDSLLNEEMIVNQ